MKKLLIIIVGLFVLTSCDIEFPFMPDFDVNNENDNNTDNNNDNNTDSDSSTDDRNDFTFHMYMEKFLVSPGYTYALSFGFGHEEGIWYDGITEFGIEVRPLNGTIINKSGWNDDYVKVSKSAGWTYFSTGANGTKQNETWNTTIFIDSSDSTIEVEWRPKWYDEKASRWMTSDGGKTNRKTFYAK